jgi:hypothetical protein
MKDRIKAGVWIDTKRAVIMTIRNDQEHLEKVYSGIESRKRLPGVGKQFTRMGKQYFTFEKKEKEKRNQQLKAYFHQVIRRIVNANDLIIIGPATAKLELEKELLKSKASAPTYIKVLTTSRLTEKQIVATIKKFFKNQQINKRNHP